MDLCETGYDLLEHTYHKREVIRSILQWPIGMLEIHGVGVSRLGPQRSMIHRDKDTREEAEPFNYR